MANEIALEESDVFVAAVAELTCGRPATAFEKFASCAEDEIRMAASLYLMGVCKFFMGKESEAKELLWWSRDAGKVPDGFLPLLGQISASLDATVSPQL